MLFRLFCSVFGKLFLMARICQLQMKTAIYGPAGMILIYGDFKMVSLIGLSFYFDVTEINASEKCEQPRWIAIIFRLRSLCIKNIIFE